MNQSVKLESMNAHPISKQDAEKIVAELSSDQHDKSFMHLHIATKYIQQNIDANNLPTVELPNLFLEQEIEEDSVYVHRQKYTQMRNGEKKDIHTLLAYVCHKDQDYLLTVAKEVKAHDPQDGFSDEYPIYNECLKELFKNIGVFCNTHKIKSIKILFNTFFFKKLIEERFPETKKALTKHYKFNTSFHLTNANNIVSNKGHFIAKFYLKHYKVVHDKNIMSHTFNINSRILHDLLSNYQPNTHLSSNFKQFWCDFLNKRHQYRLQLSTHPFPTPTFSELLLTPQKGKELYGKIAKYIPPHVFVRGQVIHLEIDKITVFVEKWFKAHEGKKPTIDALTTFIFKNLEHAIEQSKPARKKPKQRPISNQKTTNSKKKKKT
jgi:hypothetical protein